MIDAQPCRGYGKDLLHVRESKSMSKEQLAFLLGKDIEFVNRLEREKFFPSSHLMQKLSEVYHLDIEMVSGRIYCDAQTNCNSLM